VAWEAQDWEAAERCYSNLLVGIDAPEGRQVCTAADGSAYRCGRSAAKALRDLTWNREVSCDVVSTDRYDRALGRCRAGNTDLNLEMVRRGWAVAYRGGSGEFSQAESEARAAKRGLWQGLFDRPQDWRRLNAAKAGAGETGSPKD
ncbi:MAG: thermonuclease family protein, partial [Pseudomonadota bacterium]